MYDDGQEHSIERLTFDVKQGLRKARPFFATGRGHGDDDTAAGLIAGTLPEHLKLCRWEFTRLPPLPLHSTGTTVREDNLREPGAGNKAK